MSFSRYILFAVILTTLVAAESKTPRLDAIEKMSKELYNTTIKNKTSIAEQSKKTTTLSTQLLKYMELQQKNKSAKAGFYPSEIDETMQAQSDEISKLYKYIYLLLFAIAALALYLLFSNRKASNHNDDYRPLDDTIENPKGTLFGGKKDVATSAAIPTDTPQSKKENLDSKDTQEHSTTVASSQETSEIDQEPVIQKTNSKEFLQKGIKSYSDGDFPRALENFEKGIDESDQKNSLLAELYLAKAVTHDALGEPKTAVDTYEIVVDTFQNKSDEILQEQVARAMVSKGATLGKMTESKKAIRAYDEVIDKFSASPIPNVQEQVARAMFNKGVRLGQLGRPQEAIRVYGKVVEGYQDQNQPILQELVARAMYNKGVRYTKLHDLENAIKAYDEVINSFRGKNEIRVQEQVARAMFNKAMALTKQDESKEAITVYQDLIRSYKDTKSTILTERVSSASANIAELELKLKSDVTFDTENSIYKNLDFNNKLKFDMLFILSDAMKTPQDKEVEDWKEKYDDVSMEGYNFDELEEWSDTIEDVSVKYRIKEYISTFKNHGIE